LNRKRHLRRLLKILPTLLGCHQEILPHPLPLFLPALGMAGGTEPACLAGKHKQALFPAVGTPDAGKATHRIAAVKILLDNILDDWPKEAVPLIETILVFTKEPLKIK
jgi:hypothetical protein